MDDSKICFIVCTNNLIYEKECRLHIDHLVMPEGMEKEVICITGAKSMASGYNEAMHMSNARYKIYLHQDVLIIRQDFLAILLDLFRDDRIGMAGIIGNTVLSEKGYPWSEHNRRVGRIYLDRVHDEIYSEMGRVRKPYEEVISIDGLLMATQYDIEWREDLFEGWDFYDLSQSMEFRRAGYKVVVPYTDSPLCLHDNDMLDLSQYDRWKRVFWDEYGRNLRS